MRCLLKDQRDKKITDHQAQSSVLMEITQGKTKVAQDKRYFGLPPSVIEKWVNDAKKGMEYALRA